MSDDFVVIKLEHAMIYNDKFRWACRELRGRWEPKEQSWSPPIEYAEDVERLK